MHRNTLGEAYKLLVCNSGVPMFCYEPLYAQQPGDPRRRGAPGRAAGHLHDVREAGHALRRDLEMHGARVHKIRLDSV